MNRYALRLKAEDWVLIGYLAGILLWFVADTLTADEPDSGRSWTEQQVTLTEEHLQRIEDGETVSVRRWHGHELVIGGGMVIDAEEIDSTEGDTADR